MIELWTDYEQLASTFSPGIICVDLSSLKNNLKTTKFVQTPMSYMFKFHFGKYSRFSHDSHLTRLPLMARSSHDMVYVLANSSFVLLGVHVNYFKPAYDSDIVNG
jgi:hypothetical protein